MPSPGEDVQAWSTTAATNATADPLINWAEGQPRASVNNSARSMLAAHAKDRNLKNGSITTGGTANAQTFTSGVGYTTPIPTGLTVRLKVGVTNAGATTLNMDGIGAVAIKDQAGQDIGANALLLGRYVDLLYDGTNWILLSSSGASAAPFDALAYNGMQINGSMEVSQEKGTGGTTAPGYVCDGWYISSVGTMAFGALPFKQVLFPGLNWFLNIGITTAQTTLGASDFLYITQNIEGWRVARLGWGTASAQPLTLGFWTAHNRPGTYSGSVRNGAANRTYAFTYTQNAAAIEYKTVTIPGDTTGTWASDNTAGLTIFFAMACGTNLTATSANTWLNGNFVAAPGQINGVAATTDVFRITGVVVLPGSDAPSAARSPFIMRPYPQELLLCKRYFYNGAPPLVGGLFNSNTVARAMCRHPVSMRATPTLTLTGWIGGYVCVSGAGLQNTNFSNVNANYSNAEILMFDSLTTEFVSPGSTIYANTTSGNINVDARL